MQSIARQVFASQALALSNAQSRIGPEFDRAVDTILASRGRIIISGMGKSGIIGTPSFTVHPVVEQFLVVHVGHLLNGWDAGRLEG